MAKIIKVKALNEEGIRLFADFITETRELEAAGGDPLPAPAYLLSEADFLEDIDGDKEIDADKKFSNRDNLGAYLLECLVADYIKQYQDHWGLWTSLTLLWFDELKGRNTQRHEHFIPYEWFKTPVEFFNTPQNLAYRHAVRTSVQLVSRFGENARFFMSKQGAGFFGDASEQILSRSWFKSSVKVQELLFDLYQDGTGFMKKNALDKPPPRSVAKGSKVGYGGVRRLAMDVLPRVKLTHDIDIMTTEKIVKVCGEEFASRFIKKKPQAVRRK